ncbi:MAG: RNA 3'-terminal phosphate cyclase [Planctomycetes bacterium]|nr:RNA 3'-terminal phosphate cyclase [Planctomycetota bacterium]
MSDVVHIDGSTGEGGGQVLRLSVAMAAATGKSLRIFNIRAGRKNPGLRPQHVAAVDAVAQLCDAEVEGLYVGSGKLTFTPDHLARGVVKVDVGTAGSVTLVLQAVLGALSAPGSGPAEVTIRGDTDVMMAPSWDYFANVLVPSLGRAGLDMDMECQRRGFFPKGGGRAMLRTEGLDQPLRPFRPEATQDARIEGSIVWSGLPDHIPTRIDHAMRKELVDRDVGKIRKEHVEADSPRVVATLWADMGHAVLGSSMVGRRGLPSEKIGQDLARELMADIDADATVDDHLADQLVVHAVLAAGPSSMGSRRVSKHTETAIGTAREFVPLEVREEVAEGTVDLRIEVDK